MVTDRNNDTLTNIIHGSSSWERIGASEFECASKCKCPFRLESLSRGKRVFDVSDGIS